MGRFVRLSNRQKKLLFQANHANLQVFRMAPIYHFGILVPIKHQHDMELNSIHESNLWREAELVELNSIDIYGIFWNTRRVAIILQLSNMISIANPGELLIVT